MHTTWLVATLVHSSSRVQPAPALSVSPSECYSWFCSNLCGGTTYLSMFGRQLKLAVHHSAETIIKFCHLKCSEIRPPRISWVDIMAIHSHVRYRQGWNFSIVLCTRIQGTEDSYSVSYLMKSLVDVRSISDLSGHLVSILLENYIILFPFWLQ